MSTEINNNSRPDPETDQVLNFIPKTLVVGYGNPDREDDGVAWHILQGIAAHFDIPISKDTDAGIFPEGGKLDFWFNLQLMPEMATEMTNYQRICFIDAHTGAIAEELHMKKLESQFQNSPLTHHLTPESIVSIMEHLYNHKPDTLFVSVRGYEFRFRHGLSEKTAALAEKAVARVVEWITAAQNRVQV